MKLYIIGNGCPHPKPQMFGSAFVLETENSFVMIDCGPATTQKLVQAGLDLRSIHHLFFTHHHFDHNVDFPCFALTRWDRLTEQHPLHVYGPPPTEEFVELLMGEDGAFAPDWKCRIEDETSQQMHVRRGGDLPRPAPEFDVYNLQSGDEIAADDWSVKARQVQHVEPGLISLAYRLECSEGAVVFAGDCALCDPLVELAEGGDTLVAPCSMLGPSEEDPVLVECVAGSVDSATAAAQAGVDRLVFTHSAPGGEQEQWRQRAMDEAAEIFDGEIFFPQELDSLQL